MNALLTNAWYPTLLKQLGPKKNLYLIPPAGGLEFSSA